MFLTTGLGTACPGPWLPEKNSKLRIAKSQKLNRAKVGTCLNVDFSPRGLKAQLGNGSSSLQDALLQEATVICCLPKYFERGSGSIATATGTGRRGPVAWGMARICDTRVVRMTAVLRERHQKLGAGLRILLVEWLKRADTAGLRYWSMCQRNATATHDDLQRGGFSTGTRRYIFCGHPARGCARRERSIEGPEGTSAWSACEVLGER